MNTPTSFSALLKHWPSPAALAADLGVPYQTAAAIIKRGSVGVRHWPKLIEKAPERGVEGLTWEVLAKLAAGVTHEPDAKPLKKIPAPQPKRPSRALSASSAKSSKSLKSNVAGAA